jgi:hypothetical protein
VIGWIALPDPPVIMSDFSLEFGRVKDYIPYYVRRC